MSRRDTIVLAVLLNTGLLAVLFVFAINPSSDQLAPVIDVQQAVVQVEKEELVKEAPPVIFAHETNSDEVDNVLKDFAATINFDAVTPVSSAGRNKQYEHELIAINDDEPRIKIPSRQPKTIQESFPKVENDKNQFVEITVKRGDILGRIAQANNTTISAIRRANNLTSDTLQVGQVLRVPVGTKEESVDSVLTNSNRAANDAYNRYYTIQSGDNPWKIAKKFNVSVREFLRLNNLDEAKARNLRPGERVRVQ